MHQIVDFAKGVLGVKLYPGQAEALSNYYEGGCQNWLLLAGRRSGKSLISDIIACYEACVPKFEGVLRPGEERYILIVSVRLDNAILHIKNIAKMLKHTKAMGAMIRNQKEDRLELTNDCVILSMPASARAGRGYTASTLIFDELAHFVDSLGNSAAEPVFNALIPTVATFGNEGRTVITTTPGARVGIVYELFDRATSGELTDFYVTKVDTRKMNPKVSERVINNAMKRDLESATTEYFAEFSDPLACYFNPDSIDRAIDRNLRRVEKPEGKGYVMAIDPATMRDRYAFGICHREDKGLVLDYALALRPPVDPNEAEALLFDLARRFKPHKILCDTAATTQRLKNELPELEYTPFTRPLKLKIYGSLKESLNLGQLILYDEPDLIDELKALQIRNGVDIAAPKSGRITHDDLADVLALCVDALISGYYGELMPINGLRDWLDGDGTPEGYEFDLQRGYIPIRNREMHPEGVTWRNCRHRNRGCIYCEMELEAEGFYKAQELPPDFTPMDEQEYFDVLGNLIPNPSSSTDQLMVQRGRQTFKKHIKGV